MSPISSLFLMSYISDFVRYSNKIISQTSPRVIKNEQSLFPSLPCLDQAQFSLLLISFFLK